MNVMLCMCLQATDIDWQTNTIIIVVTETVKNVAGSVYMKKWH